MRHADGVKWGPTTVFVMIAVVVSPEMVDIPLVRSPMHTELLEGCGTITS
jgi:hypothetical protein